MKTEIFQKNQAITQETQIRKTLRPPITVILIVRIGAIVFVLIRILFEYLNVICVLRNGFDCEFKNINCEFAFCDHDVLSPTTPIGTPHFHAELFYFINSRIVLREKFLFAYLFAVTENRNDFIIINEIMKIFVMMDINIYTICKRIEIEGKEKSKVKGSNCDKNENISYFELFNIHQSIIQVKMNQIEMAVSIFKRDCNHDCGNIINNKHIQETMIFNSYRFTCSILNHFGNVDVIFLNSKCLYGLSLFWCFFWFFFLVFPGVSGCQSVCW